MSELDVIDVATTHRIKFSVGWEKDPDETSASERDIPTGGPKTGCRPFYCVIYRKGRAGIAELISDRPGGNARRQCAPGMHMQSEGAERVATLPVVHGHDAACGPPQCQWTR